MTSMGTQGLVEMGATLFFHPFAFHQFVKESTETSSPSPPTPGYQDNTCWAASSRLTSLGLVTDLSQPGGKEGFGGRVVEVLWGVVVKGLVGLVAGISRPLRFHLNIWADFLDINLIEKLNTLEMQYKTNHLYILGITLVIARRFPHFLLREKEPVWELVLLRWCLPSWGNSS